MTKWLFALALTMITWTMTLAQDLRMFLDIPSIYLHTPNVEELTTRSGLGLDAGFGLGTHNIMTKFSGGTTVTADFQSDEIEKTVEWSPFLRLEAGAGLWRTNGNKCARHDTNAFTALPKAAVIYAFQPGEIQFAVGAELGYFRIRDYFRNMELFLDGGWNLTTSTPYASFGFRQFLNLRSY